MITLALPIKFLIAFIIGAVIGLERESQDELNVKSSRIEAPHNVGVRTFSLISILGAFTGTSFIAAPALFVILSSTVSFLILAYYVIQSRLTRDVGFTTELALIYSYLVGVAIVIELIPIQLILAASVVVIILLSFKTKIKSIVEGIRPTEFNAFLGFALIAVVILPFLPNNTYSLSDIPDFNSLMMGTGVNLKKLAAIELFNPFKLWFIVALIVGLDVAGHFLERIIGQGRGRLIASVAGGFISSTATTQGLAQESNASSKINYLVGAAVFANVASFFQLVLLIAPINIEFLILLLPSLLAIVVTASLIGILFLRKNEKSKQGRHRRHQSLKKEVAIFEIMPALKFALLYLVVTIISRTALSLFGQNVFLLAAALASLTGIDAILITVSQLIGRGLSADMAVLTFIIVNAINLLGKSFYSFTQGKREFAFKFFIAVICMIFASFVGLLFS